MSIVKLEEMPNEKKEENQEYDVEFVEEEAAAVIKKNNHMLFIIIDKNERNKPFYKLVLKDDSGKIIDERVVPGNFFGETYTRSRYDSFRTILKDSFELAKKGDVARFMAFIKINVEPKLHDFLKKKTMEEEERKRREFERKIKEHEKEIMEIAKNPVDHILKVVDFYHIGDEKAKRQLLLVIVSRFLPEGKKLSAILTAASSSGKNNLVKAFQKLTPGEWWVTVTRMTQHALEYLSYNLVDKILYYHEYEGVKGGKYSVRIILSEGEIVVEYVKKDPKTGELKTEKKRIKGDVVFITTTTQLQVDSDMETRVFYIVIDETPEQTKKVLEHIAKLECDPEYKKREKEIMERAELIKLFFQTLKTYDVIIPEDLREEIISGLITDSLRARRDVSKVIYLVKTHALLNQYNREKIVIDGQTYLVATREDVDFVKKWVLGDIRLQEQEITERHLRALKCVRLIQEEKGGATVKEVSKCYGATERQTRNILSSLVEAGYLIVDKSHKPHTYHIPEEEEEKENNEKRPETKKKKPSSKTLNVFTEKLEERERETKKIFENKTLDVIILDVLEEGCRSLKGIIDEAAEQLGTSPERIRARVTELVQAFVEEGSITLDGQGFYCLSEEEG